MSIYASLGSIFVETGERRKRCDHRRDLHAGKWEEEFVEVYFQAVPDHTDDDVDYLPPPIPDSGGRKYRAVVVCGPNSRKDGQRYVNALMTLSGEEWEGTPFPALWGRITEALAAHLRGR